VSGDTASAPPNGTHDALLRAILNLAAFHREHEKFYASAPREQAVVLQRHSRTLQALADRWSPDRWSADRSTPPRTPLSPFEGAEDLNDPAAIQLDGVLFMEGEAEPVEITQLKAHLRDAAEQHRRTGEWLASAMQASWDVAAALIDIGPLADLLGERHRIIANDWQAAHANELIARLQVRAADILDRVDFSPAALRADLAGAAVSPQRLYSAAELIDRASDLLSESAGLVHDNERRWRIFRSRVRQLVGDRGMAAAGEVPSATARQPPAVDR